MFGSNKPFGTASAFGTSSFGNTSTPFGQSTNTFGAKPATSNVFGSSSFGVATPSQPISGGLFGSTAPTAGTGLFGQQTTAFGAPASTSTGGFGGFGATSQTTNLFGSATPSTQSSGGLFGNTSTSAFGTPRPAFGGFNASTPGTGLFGQTANTGTGMFGSQGGFTATAATSGTTIKFNPPTGTDTMIKGGVSTNIGTRHQCITCMKEYENKSLEELRMEDYAANRKGGAGSAVGMGFGGTAQQPGLFGGAAAASTSAFSFGGSTQSKPMFGTTGATNTFGSSGGLFGQPAQNQNAGLFGKSVGFGAPAASAAQPVFNFGASTGTSLFGQNNQAKPLFGQTTGSTGLFGNTATTQSTGFGTNTAFGAFGATNQPSTGLFGAKPTGFGTTNTTTTNSFSFGNTNPMGAGGGLFGKPAAPAFGTSTAFGTPSSGFGSFGTTPAAGTGLFGQTKPAATAFGQTGSMFGGSLGTGTTGFGASTFSMGGLGSNTGTGLFGGATANKAPGFGFGNTNTGFNFGATNPGASSFNFGTTPALTTNDPNNALALQQAQQQILAMTVNPFGDSPLFRNSIKDYSRETEVLKPTNPSVQKALLNDNHYKVAALPTAKIKPKPWSPVPTGKMLLFDGLEDEEPSLGTAAFVPKRSIKKLVLKNNNSQSSLTLTSTNSPNQSTRIDVSISLNNPKNSDRSLSETTPLTVDISNSASDILETRRSIIRRNSNSPVKERQSEPVISPRVNFNTSLNDSIAQLHTNKHTLPSRPCWSDPLERTADTESPNTSSADKELTFTVGTSSPSHPTKIILTDSSYYTIPTLDEMIQFIDGESCIVKDFAVGRKGYGQVMFPGETDVYGLNLDEIVSFGKKEINVYPDDDKKPPVGQGLNRKAKVILKNVWPNDKTNHSLVQDPERILKMGYKEKIERCTAQIGATFIDYKPETGTWIFEVDHFSKYGLEDSDEEMDVPKQPEKKSSGILFNQKDQMNLKFASGDTLSNQQMTRKPLGSFNLQDQEMEVSSQMMSYPSEFLEDGDSMFELSSQPTPIMKSGIDVHRIQDMKASFFQEDMDEENWGYAAFNQRPDVYNFPKKDFGLEESFLKSKKLESFSNDTSKRQKYIDKNENQSYASFTSPMKFNEIGVQDSLSALSISAVKLPEWMTDFPVVKGSSDKLAFSKPTPILTKIFLKPYNKSTLYNKQHLLSDAGYFMGQSFRVGWASNGMFVSADSSEKSNIFENYKKLLYDTHTHGKTSHCNSNFMVSLKELSSYSLAVEDPLTLQKIIVSALELQLENSVSDMEGESPVFSSKPGVEPIHSHAELFESLLKEADSLGSQADFIRQCVYVWDLLVSLWGKVPGLDEDQNTTSYASQIARREALSRWLIKSTERDISKKMSTISQREDYLVKIFLYLNSRRTADAVKLAQQNYDFRLSLLLSQAEGNGIVRKLLAKQLFNWKQNGAYDFIKSDRIVLYTLLSGMLVYEDVNCCKDLSWKQVLSLQLWYYCNPNASVQDAVKEYEESFQGTSEYGIYASPPYPPYMDETDLSEKPEEESSNMIFDTCYHILKLYCDRSHRFDMLLMPETYSPDHLDYRLSWLLHLALSSVGYNIPADIANTLHMNFASQLESVGLWDWAIFVLLHHTDTDWRAKQVKDILLRSVSLESNADMETKEKFLTERLMVPEKWIFEAKAIKANTLGKKAEEAWYLLKAGSWSKSHQIVIKNLASNAVINEDFKFLMKYLGELSLAERSSTIIDWSSGGQVYLDYINMCQIVEDVVSREASAYDLENFTPQVISLCKRLSSLPATSLKDRLSIAEMAKKTATILRSISLLQASRTKNNSSLTSLASYIKDLPMPYDYAASENRFVAHHFLEEITADI